MLSPAVVSTFLFLAVPIVLWSVSELSGRCRLVLPIPDIKKHRERVSLSKFIVYVSTMALGGTWYALIDGPFRLDLGFPLSITLGWSLFVVAIIGSLIQMVLSYEQVYYWHENAVLFERKGLVNRLCDWILLCSFLFTAPSFIVAVILLSQGLFQSLFV